MNWECLVPTKKIQIILNSYTECTFKFYVPTLCYYLAHYYIENSLIMNEKSNDRYTFQTNKIPTWIP
jgi:hypothetical protein